MVDASICVVVDVEPVWPFTDVDSVSESVLEDFSFVADEPNSVVDEAVLAVAVASENFVDDSVTIDDSVVEVSVLDSVIVVES